MALLMIAPALAMPAGTAWESNGENLVVETGCSVATEAVLQSNSVVVSISGVPRSYTLSDQSRMISQFHLQACLKSRWRIHDLGLQ